MMVIWICDMHNTSGAKKEYYNPQTIANIVLCIIYLPQYEVLLLVAPAVPPPTSSREVPCSTKSKTGQENSGVFHYSMAGTRLLKNFQEQKRLTLKLV